ncbi:hypothetical protein G7046_g5613 [Stylonectria norvegica]|nr:hypothetical protein G7046_g5613 [Stylonectria norvegica]
MPYELRHRIWSYAGAIGSCNGLLRCSQQTREEYAPYRIKLTDDIEELQKLNILVDSSYIDGVWLKAEYFWHANGGDHHDIDVIRDMGDLVSRRLKDMRKVQEIGITFQAPRRGHFVGALLMMLVKAIDAYRMINYIWGMGMMRDVENIHRPWGDNPWKTPGLFTVIFTTEALQPGQSSAKSKSFWACRSPNKLLTEQPRPKWPKRRGAIPCFYEYFLVNSHIRFSKKSRIEFRSLPTADVSSHLETHCRQMFARFQIWKPTEQNDDPESSHHQDISDEIALQSLNMILKGRDWPGYMHWKWKSDERLSLDLIYHDYAAMESQLQFRLDTLGGPPGGPLDMLRLHRFKTMDSVLTNFFSDAYWKGRSYPQGLHGVSTQVNDRMRLLFNPLADDRIEHIRMGCCEHFFARKCKRPVDSNAEETIATGQSWIECYPEGISYRQKGGSLLDWRYSSESTTLDGAKRAENALANRRRFKILEWWDCVSCCEESFSTFCQLDDILLEETGTRLGLGYNNRRTRRSLYNGEDARECYCSDCRDTPRPVVARLEGKRTYYPWPRIAHGEHVGVTPQSPLRPAGGEIAFADSWDWDSRHWNSDTDRPNTRRMVAERIFEGWFEPGH